jgi:hypothetical protein
MKKIQALSLGVIFGLTTFISGCTKEGPAGANGRDGNANVVSTTFTISNWTFNNPSYVGTQSIPAITQEILNNGAVLAYVKVGDNYSQVPLTFYQSNTFSSSIEVAHGLGSISFFFTDSDLIQPVTPGPLTFKVVVIASAAKTQNPNVDFSDYEAVKSKFNIVD